MNQHTTGGGVIVFNFTQDHDYLKIRQLFDVVTSMLLTVTYIFVNKDVLIIIIIIIITETCLSIHVKFSLKWYYETGGLPLKDLSLQLSLFSVILTCYI